jgi:alpha-D-ribose 1-methylphosphonate 5-triphosphate synthase subunit PhnG
MAEASMDRTAQPMDTARRAGWMSVLAKVDDADIAQHTDIAALPKSYLWLRRPETGLVMVRGRAGGTGAQFNLGEMAVTRCALRLADGTVGMAYVRGREVAHAERAAAIDAVLQQAAQAGVLSAALSTWIAPLETLLEARRARKSADSASTKVDFFTVVRGEITR